MRNIFDSDKMNDLIYNMKMLLIINKRNSAGKQASLLDISWVAPQRTTFTIKILTLYHNQRQNNTNKSTGLSTFAYQYLPKKYVQYL